MSAWVCRSTWHFGFPGHNCCPWALLLALLWLLQDKKFLNSLVPPKVPLPEFEISLNRRLAEEIGQHM